MTSARQVAGMIDHTILKAEARWPDVERIVDEALAHRFASVCVNGAFAAMVAGKLAGSGVKTCAVVGFPLGASDLTIKRSEATVALKQGADEIDFVAHLPHLLNGDEDAAATEFGAIVEAARDVKRSAIVKVIIESAALMAGVDAAAGEARIAAACRAAKRAGVDFVKTSTGFHGAGGATVDAVRIMAANADGMGVKASGGIRTWADAQAMIEAGATRLGCSAGVAIVTGGEGAAGY